MVENDYKWKGEKRNKTDTEMYIKFEKGKPLSELNYTEIEEMKSALYSAITPAPRYTTPAPRYTMVASAHGPNLDAPPRNGKKGTINISKSF